MALFATFFEDPEFPLRAEASVLKPRQKAPAERLKATVFSTVSTVSRLPRSPGEPIEMAVIGRRLRHVWSPLTRFFFLADRRP